MQKMSVIAVALVVLLLASVGVEVSQGQAARPEIRVRMQFAGPRTLDPVYNNRAADYFVYYNIFNYLVRWKPGGTELEPDLAERWETSDGRVWTFFLRRGVQFHKGYGEVTADDVKFSFERFTDRTVATPNAGNMANVERIDAVDRYTVRFTLADPSYAFVASQITSHPAMIVSRRAVQEKGNRGFGRDPIGTGPFIFSQWTSADEIVVTANDQHFRGRPAVGRITFVPISEEAVAVAALERGDIHYIWTRGSAEAIRLLRANRNLSVEIARRPGLVRYLALNPAYAPFGDVRVRQALAYAINKRELEVASGGQLVATDHPLASLPWLKAAADEGRFPVYKHDPERARRLLTEAGQPRLQFTFMFAHDSPAPLIAQILGEQFRKVGIEANLEGVEQRAWGDRRRVDNYHITHVGIGRGTDPDEIARELFHTAHFTPGNNSFKYTRADGLIDAGARERNPQLRQRIYIELLRMVMTDLPVIPLVNDNLVAAWRAPIGRVVNGIDNDFQGFTIQPAR
jgi:peptide/nickel transport system substrate-binding protein